MKTAITASLALLLTGCMGYPETLTPVTGFDVNRYLGKWYEIARLDHSFERGLEQVSAEYEIREDGGVTVTNRGFSREKNEWSDAVGRAYFVNDPVEGYLKVSFFGPFYSSYVIFELDEENYQYAFISGADTSYLWLLARTPSVSDNLKKEFTERAAQLGFSVHELIWVDHESKN